MTRGDDLVEDNYNEICVRSREDWDVNGDGSSVGFVQTNAKVTLSTQQKEDKHT